MNYLMGLHSGEKVTRYTCRQISIQVGQSTGTQLGRQANSKTCKLANRQVIKGKRQIGLRQNKR